MAQLAGLPASYMIIPDPLLPSGRAALDSVTSEAGPFPGKVVAAATNQGRLIPVQSGELGTGAEALRYRIVASGGPNAAEFIYRKISATSSDWYGQDDPRHWWGAHAPFTGAIGSDNCAIGYVRAINRIIAINVSGSTVNVRYQEVGVDWHDVWSGPSTWTLENAVESSEHNADIVEIDDGRLMLLVRISGNGGTGSDFDVYHSSDGLTWTLVATRIIERFDDSGAYATHDLDAQVRVGQSGDYTRLCWADSAATLITIASRDRGMTWSRLADDVTMGDSGDVDDPIPFDLIGVSDGGDFLLAYRDTVNQYAIDYRKAIGDGDWLAPGMTGSSIRNTDSEVTAICFVRTPGWLWQYVFGSNTSSFQDQDEWFMRRVRPEDHLTAASWEEQKTANYMSGSVYEPMRLQIAWAGDRIFFYSARKSEAGRTEINLPSAWFQGGWNQRSYGVRGESDNLNNYKFVQLHGGIWWRCFQGTPSAPTGSVWTQVLAGGGGFILNMNRMQITGANLGDTAYYEWSRVAASAPGWGHTTGSPAMFRWVVSLDSGDSVITADGVGVRFVSANQAATAHWDVTVRIGVDAGTPKVRVRDNVGAADLGTWTVNHDNGGSGRYTEFRLTALTNGGTEVLQLSWFDPITEAWGSSGQLTQSIGGGALSSYVRFGQLGQSVAASWRSSWREFGVIEGTTNNTAPIREFTFTNPDDLLGVLAGNDEPYGLSDGLLVSWGGAGGAIGDEFDGEIGHTYAAENAWAVDSPRIGWRSGGATPQAAQTIILDFGVDGRIGEPDSVALFGITDAAVLLDFDATSAFSSPTATVTISAYLFGTDTSPVSINGGGGATVLLTPTDRWVRGELTGRYLRITTGTLAGETYRVRYHASIGRVYLEDETGALADMTGISVGDSVVLFGDRGAVEFSGVPHKRFARMRFNDTNTATADHRLGRLLIGHSLAFGLALDWSLTDNEQPNITRYATKSAVTWAHREGPPQRTITGRLVGDASRFRESFRFIKRALDYEATPVGLVLDDAAPEDVILCRPSSGSPMDQAAWYIDSRGIRRQAGDESVTFIEEV